MKKVHILTEGFISSNGQAFLFPLIRNRHALRSLGIDVRFFKKREPALWDCDVLLIDSKVYKPYWAGPRREEAIGHFAQDYSKAGKSIFVDLNDSTGWVVPHVLPYVHRYLKSQIMRDRNIYARPLYEHRPHSDYYHRTKNVTNTEERFSIALTDPTHRDKMTVGWNSALSNYSLIGPYLNRAYRKIPLRFLLQQPRWFFHPGRSRPLHLSYRFGLAYQEATLRYQREQLKKILQEKFPLDSRKLNRLSYFQEMIKSEIVLSPFGYGEITLKDFETFICGALLMKPDMSGIETWPDLFINNRTYIPFSWDLDDVEQQISSALNNDKNRLEIAHEGQRLYRLHAASSEGEKIFCERFASLIR